MKYCRSLLRICLKKTMIRSFLPALLAVAAMPYSAHAGPAVQMFSPQGMVKKVRQVSVRFSEPMVPFGDPRGIADPFEINCTAKGTARWADPKNWTYDFEVDLPAGERCEFRVKSELRSLSGQAIEGQERFSFSTGGPSILRSMPYEGEYSRASEDQIFVLWLDAQPSEESVLANVYFAVEGIQERVGVRIVTGEERNKIIQSQRIDPAASPSPVLLIQAKQRFPADTQLRLIWGKGVATETKAATEQDQVLVFKTREPFAANFSCERANADEGCIPFLPLTIRFSAPVAWSQARKALVRLEEGRQWKPETPQRGEEEGEGDFVYNLTFNGPFPPNKDLWIEVPPGLTDDSARPLSNASKYPLQVRTGEYPPLAKFSSRFGILELKTGAVLPVTLRNLEPQVKARLIKIGEKEGGRGGWLERIKGRMFKVSAKADDLLYWMNTVQYTGREKSVFMAGERSPATKDFAIPKPNGPKAFEVVGIPFNEPGVYVVELESGLLGQSVLGKSSPMYVPTMALVTNLAVHFKWGRESSIAWVTTLDKGEPVGSADLTVNDCQGNVLWRGRTNSEGLTKIGELPTREKLPQCSYDKIYGGEKLIVVAQLGDDMSFVLDNWGEGIEPWRFELPYEYRPKAALPRHTIFDRTLLRAGETVHMKHLLRRQGIAGFSFAQDAERPTQLWIQHVGNDQKYDLPLSWDAAGVAESTWEIPKDAKLGLYEVVMPEPNQNRPNYGWTPEEWRSGSFRVEEFRVPLMRGVIQTPTEPLIAPQSVSVDFMVKYLAGGGVSNLPVKFRSQVRPKHDTQFEAFEGFTFANGPAPEGWTLRAAQQKPPEIRTVELSLDAAGSGRSTIADLPPIKAPMELMAELEFRDPNGEAQTVSSKMPLWPGGRLIGLKPDSWALSKESLKFQAAVTNLSGKPIPGASVQVDLYERKVFSHRKRLVGGFYAYEHSEKIARISSACSGVTDQKGLVFCETKSPASGNLILQATVKDEAGRQMTAHRDIWVAGKEEWWFDIGDNDRMDVIPERKRYEPGEIATFQVRAPFRTATALVTVEREGVVDATVKKISGKNPTVRIPIRGNYAPNVFISVLAVRGRVGGVKPTALVDLGRPAYKLGIAEVKVGWKAHELKVSVSPDRPVYKVREKSTARITVKTATGAPLPEGAELAVAAVDEGLLELMPNQSWQLLDAMMGRRSVAVNTATAQMHVVGKRHFGLKALPQGGGGGRQTTRELFDTLLLWKGRVPLDSNGEALVEVPLHDSLTSSRIAAVAMAGPGLFGSGFSSIRTTQDLMVLSGVAPVVREGDNFASVFTLRNTTNRNMEIDFSGRIAELLEPLKPIKVALPPGQAREVSWEINAPYGVSSLSYEITAQDKGGSADRVKVSQKVVPAVPVRVFQATLYQLEKDFQMPIQRPADAIPARGNIQVSMKPSIAGEMSGIIEYMQHYPYTCLEQKVSRAVALRDAALWQRVVSDLPSHLDSDGLAKYFPAMDKGYDGLTAYLLAISDEAQWEIPGQTKEKMASGLRSFVEGKIVRHSSLPTADLSIRKLTAVEALARAGKADPRLLQSITIEPNLWPTSAVLDWLNILQRIDSLPDRERKMEEAEQILRSRLNFQGTTMGFSTERQDALWWLMVSNDLNAVRMVLSHIGSDLWKEDMPRLLRGALGRQHRGHWDLTVANAWGRLALEKFSKTFESVPISGISRAALVGEAKALDWAKSAQGDALLLAWPDRKEQLSVTHDGSGNPWVTVQSWAAIPLKAPLSSGYHIKKSWSPIEQKKPGIWSRGDVVRVHLEINAQSDMTWIVVNDPIPAGSAILGTGLGRDSQLLTQGEKRAGWTWPAYQERSFEAFRSYYEYVPKGNWTVEYTLRLNNAGTFHLPTTRVEALYAPEMFGEIPNEPTEVRPL